ncbi:HK97 family phage prohead protease [Rhizobium sullae]|nr:HK97 family phage prohead protease [Rhizobium sullae]
MQTEKRLAAAPFSEITGRILTGYAVLWGVETRIGDFTEIFERGAFTQTLANRANLRDILLLVDHDSTQLLARQANSSLTITEDAKGLRVQASLPDTQLGNDTLKMAEAGLLGGLSVGFVAVKEEWTGNRRSVSQADLVEVSIIHAHAAVLPTADTLDVRKLQAGAEADLRARLYTYYLGA